MSNYLIEYILVGTLVVLTILYFLQKKHSFKLSSEKNLQAKLGRKVRNGYITLIDLL